MGELRVVDGGRGAGDEPDPERQRERELGEDFRAEQELLANFMIDGSLVDTVRSFVRPEYFASEAHRQICTASFALADENVPINVVTVATRLRDVDRLAQVGGTPYLTQLLGDSAAVTSAQATACARSVRDKWVRRELAFESVRARARAQADATPIEQILVQHRAAVEGLAEVLCASEKSARADAVVDRTLKELMAASETDGRGARPTGFDRLDRLAPLACDLTILAGRPGMGKTSLACAIALNIAKRGEGVLVASLEDADTKLMTRILCAEARASVQRCLAGSLGPAEWQRVIAASKVVHALPLWVHEEAPMSARELWAKCRRVKLQLAREGRQLGLVVVDYVQLIRAPRAGMKREQEVAENVRAMKFLAKDLDVPVMALAQLNRDVERRSDKRPVLSDLRESGELEQAARLVVMVYRDEVYRPSTVDRGIAELLVRKQNNGPKGLVRVRFDAESLRFENLDEEDTAPAVAPCGGCGQRRPIAQGRCSACAFSSRTAEEDRSLFPPGFEPEATP